MADSLIAVVYDFHGHYSQLETFDKADELLTATLDTLQKINIQTTLLSRINSVFIFYRLQPTSRTTRRLLTTPMSMSQFMAESFITKPQKRYSLLLKSTTIAVRLTTYHCFVSLIPAVIGKSCQAPWKKRTV